MEISINAEEPFTLSKIAAGLEKLMPGVPAPKIAEPEKPEAAVPGEPPTTGLANNSFANLPV